ncbi:MAG: UDP-N-acetylmuramoyl-L-alanyl-D-glutamate--2,6-diaminopimelate ligase [Opitutales bacterium]|tara:strand:+ start:1710 stop:3299 length:1590 start_codon:yes stop_codon:yes gene_type:complete
MIAFEALQNSVSWGPLSLAVRLAAVEGGAAYTNQAMREKTLKELFKGESVVLPKGKGGERVACLITDSRRVVQSSLFFAMQGAAFDGDDFIEEAIGRGAAAIVSEKPKPRLCPIPYIQVIDIRETLARVARKFFNYPDKQMDLLGVTGTNGKTTVTTLTQYLLQNPDSPVGLLGTNCYDLGGRVLPSYRTTPESVDICAMLAQMHDSGCEHAVMEVSSHGLEQKRVFDFNINCAAFLNLSKEHLDYHESMEAYFAAKRLLFRDRPGLKHAVINRDDAYGERLIDDLKDTKVERITFGRHPSADVRAENVDCGPKGTTFDLVWPKGRMQVETHLLGMYNVSNILASLALCYVLNKDLYVLGKRVSGFEGVEGRMEPVNQGQPFRVLVDYAHTEDALRNALNMLQTVTPGRVLTVFGCGGERDREKRPKMMAVAQALSDLVWATSDNPRYEAQSAIFEDMRTGLSEEAHVSFLEDRRDAIEAALQEAKPGDCVLIAGKGHEAYQDCGGSVLPFDDRAVARAWLTGRGYSGG